MLNSRDATLPTLRAHLWVDAYQAAKSRAMQSLSGGEAEPEEIEPAHLSDVLESLAQAKRREFATDAEVEAAYRRFAP